MYIHANVYYIPYICMNWYTALNNGCFNLPCYNIADHVLEINPTLSDAEVNLQLINVTRKGITCTCF